MMNKAESTPRLWQMIVPAATALVVALIGLGSAIYQTDKPIQLTAVAQTSQAATQTASTPPLAAAAQGTPTALTVPSPTAPNPAPSTPPGSAAPGPVVMVSNRLALAVKVYLNSAYILTLEPGNLETLPLESAPADLRWSVIRPTNAKGQPLGSALGGAVRGLKGGDEIAIVNQDGEQPYFYPIVSNTSSKDCKVTIDDGWTSEMATGVAIPARQEGVVLGYYPLYSYSNVTLECGGQFYWWGLRPNEHNRTPIYYEVEKDTGIIEFTMK